MNFKGEAIEAISRRAQNHADLGQAAGIRPEIRN